MAASIITKYDSLPFIDSSGKDCFEAGADSPAFDSNENTDLKSEAVEPIKLDLSNAFGVFQDKYLDSSKIDFSDRILSSHNGGYQSRSVYEIIGEQVSKETPQQKYQRLQHELNELAEEVEKIQESAATTNKSSPVELAQEVKALHKQLHDLHLEKILGVESLSNDGTQPGTWARQIVNELQSFKAKGGECGKQENEDKIVYKMHYKPEHARFAQAAKLSELEGKIKEMESFIGKDQTKLQSIISDSETYGSTLMDTTSAIHAKLTLFDITHIDIIAARLQGLLHCINEISQKKSAIEDVEKQTKINELHQLITSWDSVATVVPDLIERLKSLRTLNEQATTFSQSLEHLTTTQTEVHDQLCHQKETLEKFEKSFNENVNGIQANCSSLEARINNLMKKIGT